MIISTSYVFCFPKYLFAFVLNTSLIYQNTFKFVHHILLNVHPNFITSVNLTDLSDATGTWMSPEKLYHSLLC